MTVADTKTVVDARDVAAETGKATADEMVITAGMEAPTEMRGRGATVIPDAMVEPGATKAPDETTALGTMEAPDAMAMMDMVKMRLIAAGDPNRVIGRSLGVKAMIDQYRPARLRRGNSRLQEQLVQTQQ